MKTKKIIINYQDRIYEGRRGLVSPEKICVPPWKNVLDVV